VLLLLAVTASITGPGCTSSHGPHDGGAPDDLDGAHSNDGNMADAPGSCLPDATYAVHRVTTVIGGTIADCTPGVIAEGDGTVDVPPHVPVLGAGDPTQIGECEWAVMELVRSPELPNTGMVSGVINARVGATLGRFQVHWVAGDPAGDAGPSWPYCDWEISWTRLP
jgi:hypothetical protein